MDKIPGGAWIAAAIVIVGLAYIFFVARPSLVHEECEALASKNLQSYIVAGMDIAWKMAVRVTSLSDCAA